MRHFFLYFVSFSLLLLACGQNKNGSNQPPKSVITEEETIRIQGSDVMYPLVEKWSQVFIKENPLAKMSIRPTCTQDGIRLLNSGKIQIAMSSRSLTKEESALGLEAIPVAIDVVLPVFNFNNNHIQSLTHKGLSVEKLKGAFTGQYKTWGHLLGNDSKDLLEPYILTDTNGTTAVWCDLLNASPSLLQGTTLITNQAVYTMVSQHQHSIGYCSSSVLYNPQSKLKKPNIYILPIDLNNNGQADDNELRFDRFDDLQATIAGGQYPSPPRRMLYLMYKKPMSSGVKAFLRWASGVGQNYCANYCLININKDQAQKNIGLLK